MSTVLYKDGAVVGLAADEIETISADTDLSTLGYLAIESPAGFTVYYGDDDTNTLVWAADKPFIIPATAEAKLTADTLCFVYNR